MESDSSFHYNYHMNKFTAAQVRQFLVEELDHMEVVENDGGLRQLRADCLNVGWGHVNGDRFDPRP